MAAQPKEYFDIKTAAKKDSYLIDKNSLAPEVLASKFKKIKRGRKKSFIQPWFSQSLLSQLVCSILKQRRWKLKVTLLI
ncbi:hypothetical protein [Lactococcus fujiensis]|uniref:hypothetical protein n=1 Tax=Lactococcus fujiensis TaxID=610251 RepID=UPI000AA5B3C0|nr:hypothetical protein [Lactococcus fujiensis]